MVCGVRFDGIGAAEKEGERGELEVHRIEASWMTHGTTNDEGSSPYVWRLFASWGWLCLL